MIRFVGAAVVLGGLLGLSGTAHAYKACASGYANSLSTFYVKIGGQLLTYTQWWWDPCLETGATGPVSAGRSPDKMVDCRYAVAPGQTQAFTARYSVTNPGIGGMSPVASCSVTLNAQ